MNTCKIFREEIQNYIDDNSSLTENARKHINKCNECKNYFEFFLKIKREAKKNIDDKIKKTGRFDLSFYNNIIVNKSDSVKIFSYKKYFAIAAVFIFIILCSFFISLHIREKKALKIFMINENNEYITDLMDYSLNNFDEENNISVLETAWFEGVGLVSEIMGEFVLNGEQSFENE